jgi:hypothetical protein
MEGAANSFGSSFGQWVNRNLSNQVKEMRKADAVSKKLQKAADARGETAAKSAAETIAKRSAETKRAREDASPRVRTVYKDPEKRRASAPSGPVAPAQSPTRVVKTPRRSSAPSTTIGRKK